MGRRSLAGILFLTFFLVNISFSQQPAIDSLKNLLKRTSEPATLADIHLTLSFLLYDIDIESGFAEATSAYELSKKNEYAKGEKMALALLGFKYFLEGDHTKALRYYQESDAIDSEINPVAAGYTLNMMANIYRIRSSYDSAKLLLSKAIKILEKADSKRYLAYTYKNLGLIDEARYNLDEAEEYFNKSLELRSKIGDRRGIIDSHFLLGTIELNRSNFVEANKYFDVACKLIGDDTNVALNVQCYYNDGNVHYKLGDFELALKQLFKALDLLKNQNFTYLYAQINQRIGDVYSDMGQSELALTYAYEALRNFERLKAKKDIGAVLSEISWIQKGQLNFSLALDLLQRSQEVRESIYDRHGISNCLNIRGLIYFQQKKYDQALQELNNALEIRRKINHREGVADVLFNMALVFEELGDYKKALDYQLQALRMEEEFASDQGLGISFNSIGELLIRMGDFEQAESYLAEGQGKALKTGSKILLYNNYKFFSDLFEKKGDYQTALHYRQKYDLIKDSVYSMSNSTKIAEMQALYQVEKKNQEIALQATQLKLQQDEIRQKNIIIASVLVGILLTALLAYVSYRYYRNMRKSNHEIIEQKEEIQAQSEELVEANEIIGKINRNLEHRIDERTSELKQAYKELDTFFYRSSHDFRRPLTTFLGLAEVAKLTVKDTNALQLFDKVRETAINLDRMLVKLQSISDLGAQQLVYKEVFVQELIGEILDTYNEAIVKKNIRVSIDIGECEAFYSYPAMVKIVIENLIENAIQFCGVVNPYIRISIFTRNKELILKISDNGQGIKEEFHSRIFDMYYRASQNSKGNGLGLYIVKKSVVRLNGAIQFLSTAGAGSTFIVTLPSAKTIHNTV